VSSLDWHPKTNRLLSASYDRSCIVWEQNEKAKFVPQQCVTREAVANTSACWNVMGNKFAVGSSTGMVRQCYWNEGVKMWIASQEKARHDEQTVNCVRYDPGSGRALASCGMDGTV
jgi:actin related protein 2/3 complex subunit 1A/1B